MPWAALTYDTALRGYRTNIMPKNANADFYSGILADFDKPTSGFTMKPEAGVAFARLGCIPACTAR